MEIINQKKNPLLKRKEIWFLIEHKGKSTPNRREILSGISKTLKTKEELIIIDKIFSQTGKPASKVKALVYSKKEHIPKPKLEKMERRFLPVGKRGKKKEAAEKEVEVPEEAKIKKELQKPEEKKTEESKGEE